MSVGRGSRAVCVLDTELCRSGAHQRWHDQRDPSGMPIGFNRGCKPRRPTHRCPGVSQHYQPDGGGSPGGTDTPSVDIWRWTQGQPADVPEPCGAGKSVHRSIHTVAWSYEFSSYGHPDGFSIEVRITFASEFRANGGPWAGLDDVTRTYTGIHVVEQVLPLRVASTLQAP